MGRGTSTRATTTSWWSARPARCCSKAPRIASVGTVPFYGGGIKMFPFAGQKPGYFQLRVSNIGLLRGLSNIRGVWRGTYRPPDGAFDFLCRRIRIESELPLPYH